MILRNITLTKCLKRLFSQGASVLDAKGTGIIGTKPGQKSVDFEYLEFDHLGIWSGNPKQAAHFYSSLFGFNITECKDIYSAGDEVKYLLENGNVKFLISGPAKPNLGRFHDKLRRHGDFLRTVGLRVDDLGKVRTHFENRGMVWQEGTESEINTSDLPLNESKQDHIQDPDTLARYSNQYFKKERESLEKEHPEIDWINVEMFGSTEHCFIERAKEATQHRDSKSSFLPGLTKSAECLQALNIANNFFTQNGLRIPNFKRIDHVGFPQEMQNCQNTIEKYYNDLGFHMFWYIDEKAISSKMSSLKSTVVSDHDHRIKFPIFEPVEKERKSQIQEFLDHNDGAGAQHIAIEVDDIITTVAAMRARGVEFLSVCDSYYQQLFEKLAEYKIELDESLEEILQNEILVDFDSEGNYLLQIFTKPLLDRPTLFLEFIQRNGHEGFGEGNFNRLFLSIEREQGLRGNLV